MTSNGKVHMIGIDIGTTNWKVIAYDLCGRVVASYITPCMLHHEGRGWAVHDPQELWQWVCSGLRKVVAEVGSRNVASIAIASVGEAGVLLDKRNLPVYPIIAWFDPRTQPQEEWWERELGRSRIYHITGYPLQYIASINKILWIRDHEPAAFRQGVRWLCVADYIAFMLCGEAAMDYSLASRTMALDIKRRSWSKDILEKADIDASLLPPLLPGGEKLGKVSPAVAELTGLPTSCVVATGGHDHVCGALAVGASKAGVFIDSAGTAEVVLLTADEALISNDLMNAGLASGCHCIRDRYYVMGVLQTSGASLEWARCVFRGDSSLPGAFTCSSPKETPLFLPHLRGSVSPYVDSRSLGAFVGLRAHHTAVDLTTAVVEGVCYEARLVMDELRALTGLNAKEVIFLGGGANNDVWVQLKSDTLGRVLEVHRADETVARGAAILGALGAGVFGNLTEALDALCSRGLRVFPSKDASGYHDAKYQIYSGLYKSLKGVNALLFELYAASEPSVQHSSLGEKT